MNSVQVIEKDGVPRSMCFPPHYGSRCARRLRTLLPTTDAADVERFDREDDGTRIPFAVMKAQLGDGSHPVHPVKAWREHRGLTVQQLASAAGLSKPFVSQIETGHRVGTTATLKKLAQALGTTVLALLP